MENKIIKKNNFLIYNFIIKNIKRKLNIKKIKKTFLNYLIFIYKS